jgi:hypothetical protein
LSRHGIFWFLLDDANFAPSIKPNPLDHVDVWELFNLKSQNTSIVIVNPYELSPDASIASPPSALRSRLSALLTHSAVIVSPFVGLRLLHRLAASFSNISASLHVIPAFPRPPNSMTVKLSTTNNPHFDRQRQRRRITTTTTTIDRGNVLTRDRRDVKQKEQIVSRM